MQATGQTGRRIGTTRPNTLEVNLAMKFVLPLINRRPVLGLRRLAVAAGLSVALASGVAAEAQAASRLSIDQPGAKTVSGKVPFTARTSGGAAVRARFYVNGRMRFLDRAPKWKFGQHGVLDTARMRPGRHRLAVYARFRNGSLKGASVEIQVRSASARATWRSSFEQSSFSEWSWWGKGDSRYAGHSVVSASEAGIPSLDGGRVAKFSVNEAQSRAGSHHSKVMKNWGYAPPETTSWRDDAGRQLERLPNNSPAGTYRANFYLPADYRKSPERWTNIFQFKEAFYDSSGKWRQDPQWWLNISQAGKWGSAAPEGLRSDHPVVHANNWKTDYSNYRPKLVALPLGRWFEIKAEVYPGQRIEWYLAGQRFDTSYASEYPVGFSKSRPTGWVFGVGHYDGIGKLWADKVSFQQR